MQDHSTLVWIVAAICAAVVLIVLMMFRYAEEADKRDATAVIKCPYCGNAGWFPGPRGGAAVNILCSNFECRHWLNNLGRLGVEDIERVASMSEWEKWRDRYNDSLTSKSAR